MSEIVTHRLRISGRVQGVGYRVSLLATAQQLGLKGWVRNRLDGSVEAVAQGDARAVADLTAWAHQGPPSARVAQVKSSPVSAQDQDAQDALGPFAGFHVRGDA